LLFSISSPAVLVLALSATAFADGTPDGPEAGEADTDFSLTLPPNLADWSEAAEIIDLDETPIISLRQFPQGRMKAKPPYIDWSRWEVGGYVGVVDYSTDFKAHVDAAFGLTTRVPAPGLPLGNWGLWADLFMAHITRDIPFYYPKSKAEWFGGVLGGDYTFINGEIFFMRGQIGGLYAYWNGIYGLKNGFGVLAGADLGFYWIKWNPKSTFTINPQITYDGKNWVGFINFGLNVEF
jgi:hypothetical protein